MECQFVDDSGIVAEGNSDALEVHEEDEAENHQKGYLDEKGH